MRLVICRKHKVLFVSVKLKKCLFINTYRRISKTRILFFCKIHFLSIINWVIFQNVFSNYKVCLIIWLFINIDPEFSIKRGSNFISSSILKKQIAYASIKFDQHNLFLLLFLNWWIILSLFLFFLNSLFYLLLLRLLNILL